MGLPALRHEVARAERPKLELVQGRRPANRDRRKGVRHGGAATAARSRETFRTFVAVAIVFSALGIGRVALASRAAAVSIESGRLAARLKEARFEGDSLEIRISQLATPERIRSVAGSKMKMAPATGISYVTIDGAGTDRGQVSPATKATDERATSSARETTGIGLLSSVMHAAAGEAQILLLGDVGLSSAR
jgi:cell division protein FtsL